MLLAAGTGLFTSAAEAEGNAVVSLDLSLPMLRRAVARGARRPLQGDGAALPLRARSFESVLDYIQFSLTFCSFLAVLGVIVLRIREPDLKRPYRMWGYPVTPLAFAAVAFWFVINTIITTPASSLIGLAIVASGVPVYYIWRRKTSNV